MQKKSYIIALCYDFDGTLSPDNMQEYDFIPRLQSSPKEFWEKTREIAAKQDADEILAYMFHMCDEAKKKELPIKRANFRDFGKKVTLYPGLVSESGESWFDVINAHAAKYGALVRHYIISSGIKEMIEGTAIADRFEKIYASSFMYDIYDIAHWPAMAINYTTKMQFLFRINKGILNIQDSINGYMPEDERPVPFRRMIYFGDGSTDIPAMKLVKTQGGYSIAVHGANDPRPENLIEENRVNFVAEADYSKDSALTAQVKRVIDKICAEREVETEGR